MHEQRIGIRYVISQVRWNSIWNFKKHCKVYQNNVLIIIITTLY